MIGSKRLLAVVVAGVAAALLVVAATTAQAHHYFWDGIINAEDADGFHHVYVNAGETITLTVANAEGQSCNANIAAASSPDVAFATMTSPEPAGARQTRHFKITGVAEGTTGFDISVDGVSPCNEHTHNLFIVHVLPRETAVVKSLTGAGRSETRLFNSRLTLNYNDLRSTSRETIAGVANGSIAPATGAGTILEAWYGAWSGGYFAGRDTLRNLRNYGSGLISSWPECTGPRLFGDGSRGPFDLLHSDIRKGLGGYYGKLDKQIAFDVSAFRKATAKLDIGFDLNYRLLPYPELDVSGPSRNAPPEDPSAPLYINYAGAATYRTAFSGMTCVGFSGLGDPAKGQVRFDLSDGTGVVGTKTGFATGLGVWSVMFDEMPAGKTYRLDASYVNGGGYDTTRIFAPPRF